MTRNFCCFAIWIGLMATSLTFAASKAYQVTSDDFFYSRDQHQITFTGHVHATREDSELHSDQLILYTDVHGQLIKLIARGKPAHYNTLTGTQKKRLYAEGNTIIYDLAHATVYLREHAKTTQDGSIITAPLIIYYPNTKTLESHGNTHQQNKIVLQSDDNQ